MQCLQQCEFGILGAIKKMEEQPTTTGNRRQPNFLRGTLLLCRTHCTIYRERRTLTSVEEAADEEAQHSLHINATGLPTSCVGCTVAIALIQTSCVAQPMHMIVHLNFPSKMRSPTSPTRMGVPTAGRLTPFVN
mmetsp:Transcript_29678/g.50610  ORF Transcript_29678/g.50610 Transcript_29678/m.50610 type:complete len:134 (+) Transcript_29678:133-534(+)